MPKKKRDYAALKLAFFKSDMDEVKAFIESKWGSLSWSMYKNTLWRAKEKQEFRQQIMEKAMEKVVEKEAEKIEIPVETLNKARHKAVSILIKKLKEEKVPTQEAINILKTLRTELCLPNNYSKVETKAEIEEELNEEDKALIQKFINERWWVF